MPEPAQRGRLVAKGRQGRRRRGWSHDAAESCGLFLVVVRLQPHSFHGYSVSSVDSGLSFSKALLCLRQLHLT